MNDSDLDKTWQVANGPIEKKKEPMAAVVVTVKFSTIKKLWNELLKELGWY